MKSSMKWSGVAVLALVASSFGIGTPTQASAPPLRAVAAPTTPAAPAALGNGAVAVARQHLAAHASAYGLSGADVDGLRVSSVVPTAHNGLTNVYLQQRVDGIDVSNAMLNVAVTAQGTVFRVASSAVGNAAQRTNSATPKLTDVAAAQLAADALGLEPTSSFASSDGARGADRTRALGDGGISSESIPAQLVFEHTDDGDLRLAWELVIDELDGAHWWQIRMDARTGAELGRTDWVDDDSHRVFPMPVESPSFASPVNTRTLVSNPATSASPFGWNDTDGAAGPESTLTLGNNVKAYTDTDHNNAPDPNSSPDGGAGLAFDFPLDLTQAPATYRPAAVSNLYFTNNRIHDVLYRYGFDEAAGNFQVNNYGHGGAGADPVNAEAQDGLKFNNADFGTPPDGSSPRMQMFVFNLTTPNRDGDFDNGVMIHEYGHGVSNRLTGGPANVSCLNNDEQAGEGWSDFIGYMLTMPSGTEPAAGIGMGTYVLGQATNGSGVRSQKYSTNQAINTENYDSIKGWGGDEHFVGEVWAEMLWEVNWAMVAKYGFTADLDAGNAGNTRTLQLVMDGLKLQPCSPGFVDARDAIIAADQADNGGANKCLLWTAFAKRGLGFSASQGSSTSATDGTQAFDLPASCVLPPAPSVTASTPSTGAVAVAFTSDPSAGITSFNAECVSTDGGVTGTQSGPVSPLTVSGLTTGKTYQCHVMATNPIGSSAFGAFGDPVQLPMLTAPGAPVISSAKATSPKKAKVTFTLGSTGGSPVTSYSVTCQGKHGAKTRTKTGPASPITVKGLTPGKKYTCTVTATNAVGTGPASAKSKKLKMPKPQAPHGTHHRQAAMLGRL
jgi:extracellular elastinolytic metalloproteinase